MNSKLSPENITDWEEDNEYGLDELQEDDDFLDFMKDVSDDEMF